MADGGVSLSLDDYIQIKRKQGSFKIGRKGVKAQPQRGGRGKGKGRIVPQKRQQQTAGNQGQQQLLQNRQRQVRGGRRNGPRFNNNNRIVGQGQNSKQAYQQRRLRGMRNQLNTSRRGKGRPQRQFVDVRNSFQGQPILRGISQHIVRGSKGRKGNRQNRIAPLIGPNRIAPLIRQNRSQFNIINSQRGTNYFRANNRRAVLKLAKKRLQRARLQLNRPLVGARPGRRSIGAGTLRTRLSLNSGVRRSRNGFVTVSSPAEKQIERLFIQEKIQKARNARNNKNYNQTQVRVSTAFPRNNIIQTHIANSNIQGRYARNRPRPSTSIPYDPYHESMGGMMTMYSDQSARNISTARAEWIPPIIRTTTNNQYQAARSSGEYDLMNHGLNPEIQKKISFIQSRTRSIDSPGIIPDFRAPIASSTLKLGDRFRMYMQ